MPTSLQDGDGKLVVHRAKAVVNPRPESEALIGTTVGANKPLSDLRTNIGVEPSGLSVQITKALITKH